MTRVLPVPEVIRQIRGHSEAAGLLLARLCQIATDRDESLFLVGGLVRDMFLVEPRGTSAPPGTLDLDLAIDAEPADYVDAIVQAADGPVAQYRWFVTASAVLADGTGVDLARTRTEHYPAPGALPEVEPAPIEGDLRRRDFTINAAAIALSGADAGRLLDPFGAADDLHRRLIRTLHRNSFRDDPTRLIRAARYAARIGGTLEQRTRGDARRDRALLSVLSAERFGNEWRRLLHDPSPPDAIAIAQQLKLPQSREPRWSIPRRAAAQSAEHFWASIGLTSREPQIETWLPRSVGLQRSERTALAAGVRLRGLRRRIASTRRPSRAAAILADVPAPALEAAAQLWSGSSADSVCAYLSRRDTVRAPITAERLMALGVAQGPALGEQLRRLEAMVWDGDVDPRDRDAVARLEEQIRYRR